MDKEILNKIINAEPTSFTLEEIRDMMDEELDKDPSEMDTDFVDMCVEVLERAADEQLKETKSKEGGKPKYNTVRRVFMVAAVIIILFSFAVPVSAKYINSAISDKIVRFYSDYFSIDLRSDEDKTKRYSLNSETLIKDLNDEGLENIVLPKAMLEYHFSEITGLQKEDPLKYIVVDFCDSSLKNSGSISLKQSDYTVGEFNVSTKYDRVEVLNFSDVDVVVFGNDDYSGIIYMLDGVEYLIDFNKCNFNTVYEIAKTLE